MTRKFEVSFTVETDNYGFVPHRSAYARREPNNRQKAVGPDGNTVYFVPAEATVTEVTEMKVGNYLETQTYEVFRRSTDGRWEFFSSLSREWRPGVSVKTDADARGRDLMYLGNSDDR